MEVTQLNGGIPRIHDYERLIRSELFLEMEAFSSSFLNTHRQCLEDYSKKWVSDPLHQWSRQWEYPFTYCKLASHVSYHDSKELNILDAGSGITFFPYFLKSQFTHAAIYCCDRDGNLEDVFTSMYRSNTHPITFSVSSLDHTQYKDAFFDCVYCISVIEHTNDYESIIRELHRIIKPGGLLIATFDISIDGSSEISPIAASQLLLEIEKRFINDDGSTDISISLRSPNILTTKYAAKHNPRLLPWSKFTRIFRYARSVIQNRRFNIRPSTYTVYCQSFTKHTT